MSIQRVDMAPDSIPDIAEPNPADLVAVAAVQGQMNSMANRLTEREKQILRLIAEDSVQHADCCCIEDFGEDRGIPSPGNEGQAWSEGTAGMVRYAIKAGLIDP